MRDSPEDFRGETQKLIEEDELLDTIADAAKRLCGRRPTHHEVEDFLKRIEGVKPITQKSKQRKVTQ
ncbi:MAG: hypothetical protein OXP71_01155 [Candidatus Poribacteria bacterium]|nr:hypothetical protein [Candidatus Poribacteria bacterium]